ncbi:MAG: 1-(5-phosphoribosyl)-5-[(5-phosphoribosylamino)methylideneamino]imidazole-4-carboxamide isomerase [Lachnospiraceae bacterium]|nr:1-(5-phosphoribosyl)-5-[(5-phosphoribosylamino)methylideneamino]imidazole-4-carboxamide isomerase [Lachnospiraceae bacterium]
MQLYPAIDIKDKKCVRLKQGLFDQVQVYSENPVEVALAWEAAGASFIHLVDLDGALLGRGVNRDVICEIVRSVHVPVQLGGGIRSLEDMEEVLNMGVFRGIVGTKAVTDPKLLKKMVDSFGPSHVVCGIDAKNGLVATQGWVDVSNISAIELALQMKVYGVRTVVYTDISKDGMLTGPNVSATKTLSEATGLDIIASGGMSCMDDLQAISDAKIHGAIIGKALYEKRIDLKGAVEKFEKN